MAKVNIASIDTKPPPDWQRDRSRPGWLRNNRVEVGLASGDRVERELNDLLESDKELLKRLAD